MARVKVTRSIRVQQTQRREVYHAEERFQGIKLDRAALNTINKHLLQIDNERQRDSQGRSNFIAHFNNSPYNESLSESKVIR